MIKKMKWSIYLVIVLGLSACSITPITRAPGPTENQAGSPNINPTRVLNTQSLTTTPVVIVTPVVKPPVNENEYIWTAGTETLITLSGQTGQVTGRGASFNGSRVTISDAGTYLLRGNLTDGQILVDSDQKGIVRLVLQGVDLHNSSNAAIYIAKAQKVIILLADQTSNNVSDGKVYTFEKQGDEEPNAAIFSKSDLTIAGNGALSVTGNFNDGIASKDSLLITSGNLVVRAVDDGIRGKDRLMIQSGRINIEARGDAIKSDNDEDPALGYVLVEGGDLSITSGKDGITAQTQAIINNGKLLITSGGGSSSRVAPDVSSKGIKGLKLVSIGGGEIVLNSADDGLHSNEKIVINGGNLVISSGDDGIHADESITINQGDIQILKSYEGIESAVITINNGSIHLRSDDDGINVAGGNNDSGNNPPAGFGGRMPPQGAPRQNSPAVENKYFLYIHGGTIVVEAVGDGIDVNGAIEMTAGLVLVNGPVAQMNSAIDYDVYFKMSGGYLVAAGSAGMAQAPGTNSSQLALMVFFTGTQPANTLVHIQSSNGKDLLTFAPKKEFQSLVFSSPELEKGVTYEIFTAGKSSGSNVNGLYQAGVYSNGTKFQSVTLSGVVTTVGSSPNRRRP